MKCRCYDDIRDKSCYKDIFINSDGGARSVMDILNYKHQYVLADCILEMMNKRKRCMDTWDVRLVTASALGFFDPHPSLFCYPGI